MGERPTADAPHRGKRRTPPALPCRLHSAQGQLARARCGVGDGSPRQHPPHPQAVGSGPRPHAPRTGGRALESGQPRTPHTQTRGAPPQVPSCCPQKRAKPARKSTRCGVGDRLPRPHPLYQQPVGSGPRQHAPVTGRSGVGDRPTPNVPDPGNRRPPPPGALVPPPHCTEGAQKSARCGVGDASPRPHPPHPQRLRSGPRPHTPRRGGRAFGERPTPDAPHPGKRRPPRAASCRPHSVQSQLTRACAVGLVTGPHAHSPRTYSQWVAGPGRTPQGRAVGRGRVPSPGRSTPRQEALPPGALLPPPQRVKPARKSTRCGVGDGSQRPHRPHPQPVGSGRQSHAPRTGVRAWESALPRTPHTKAREAPSWAPSCRSHSAQSELARACAVALVTGPHAHNPRTQNEWVAGPGCTPQGRAVGHGTAPYPGRPTPRQEPAPPRAPSCRPHSAGSQLPRARCGLGDGSPHPHPPPTTASG